MIIEKVAQIYYLKKIKPNKWLLVASVVLAILLSSYLSVSLGKPWISLIGILLAMFLISWTIERFNDKDQKTDIKGKPVKQFENRPKAKPNRVKNRNNQDKA